MSIASIMSGTPASIDVNINDVDFPTITVAGTASFDGLVDISGAGKLLVEHTPVEPGHWSAATAPFRANVNGWMGLNAGENASVRLVMGPAPSGANLDYCSVIQATNNFNANYESDLSFWTHGAASTAGDPTKQMEIDDAGDVTILNGALNVNLGLMNAKAGAVIGAPNLVAAPTFSVVAASGTGTVYDSLYNKPVIVPGITYGLGTFGPTGNNIAVNPITAPAAGWYLLETVATIAGPNQAWTAGTSALQFYVEKNNIAFVDSYGMTIYSQIPGSVAELKMQCMVKLAAGDVITPECNFYGSANLGDGGGAEMFITQLQS